MVQLTNTTHLFVAFKVWTHFLNLLLSFYPASGYLRSLKFLRKIISLNKTPKIVVVLVFWQVKTTSPKKYCVRPNVGVVAPKSTCEFSGMPTIYILSNNAWISCTYVSSVRGIKVLHDVYWRGNRTEMFILLHRFFLCLSAFGHCLRNLGFQSSNCSCPKGKMYLLRMELLI